MPTIYWPNAATLLTGDHDDNDKPFARPAWWAALFAGVGSLALGESLAYTDRGIALTEQIMAVHPGAARPMQAYMP